MLLPRCEHMDTIHRLMKTAKLESLRFITSYVSNGCDYWYVRVGLSTEHCCPKLFSFNTYGSKTKALKAAKEYRDNQEVILAHKYQLRFDLGYNPKKESVWLGCTVKTSGEYWNWIASYYHPVKKLQYKKTYSINKYGTREAKRLAYKWRDEQRSQDEVHIAN